MAGTIHYLEPDELKRLLDVAAKYSKRDVCMILLSYRHGLRISELCGLTLEDVDEVNGRLVVRARKTRRKKGTEYFEALMGKDDFGQSDVAAIHQWLKERAGYPNAETSPMLFLSRKIKTGGAMLSHSWTLRFKKLALEAGLRPEVCHPHVLRHTTAINCVESGVPLHLVSSVLRHASLASLSVYVKPQQSAVDAAKAKAFAKF
jgi:integrase